MRQTYVCRIAIAAALGFVGFAPPANAGTVNVPTIQPPSVHVSAPKVAGSVAGRTSVPTGNGAGNRVFVTGENSAGNVVVQFGNGVQGARTPTGQSNISAVYRKGIGSAGSATTAVSNPLTRGGTGKIDTRGRRHPGFSR